MAKIRDAIKAIIPPIFLSVYRFFVTYRRQDKAWSGNYTTWAEAQIHCSGYDSDIILEKVKNALLKVKNSEATYERDSVLFDEIKYSFGLLAGLQMAALENDHKLCVLDFGGSLGSSYYQNKEILSSIKELRWCIVEQPHFIDCGRANFQDDQLKFYYTIEECVYNNKPNVLLLSSVLQYLEKPSDWIEKFIALGIPYIILDRTAFVENEKDILTVQNVPKNIYSASYPCWFFNENKLLKKFQTHYHLVYSFDALDLSNLAGSYFKGILLKQIPC